MYDITARDTFDSLASWISELDTFAGTGQGARDVVRMIVGNKVDKVRSSFLLPSSLFPSLHTHHRNLELTPPTRSTPEWSQQPKVKRSRPLETHLGCFWNVLPRKGVKKLLGMRGCLGWLLIRFVFSLSFRRHSQLHTHLHTYTPIYTPSHPPVHPER